jgi:hypothetical protein
VGAVIAGAAVLMSVVRFLRRREAPVTAETIAAQLNRLCPSLEESAGLWLREPSDLTLIERLQLRRTNAAWEALAERATLACPRTRALRPAVVLCAAAASATVLVILWPRTGEAAAVAVQPAPVVSSPTPKVVAPALRTAALEIAPPAYLGEPARRVEGLDAEVAEGSVVTWDLDFTGDVMGVSLVFAHAKEHVVADPAGGGRFRARATITETRIYQLALTHRDGKQSLQPELHALKAIRDQPPRLTWQEPAASRTVVAPAAGRPLVTVKLGAVDDHGNAGAHLIMTVARGPGARE